MLRGAALGVCAAALVACAGAAAPASADVRWLCNPSFASDPCRGDQTTRHFSPSGSSRVFTPRVPKRPPIDCFYVYPTTSNQPTTNATKSPDPEIQSIAEYQAQRFSTRCRLFVPLYRQVTAAGVVLLSQTHDTKPYETAYSDVREAWRSYLRNDNHGRGFVLIGHSQGSRMLRALIRYEIDRRPAVRRRMVSAIIPGANANDADFQNVQPCTRRRLVGCVIAYSTFDETPPDNARFGRTDNDPVGGALGLPHGPGLKVLCTNPSQLVGEDRRLRTLLPSKPFAPGVIAVLLVRMYGGPPPSADTPWLQPRDHYNGRCEWSNHAHVLMLSPVDGARHLTPSPDSSWGTHLADVNIDLGNLLRVVRNQTRRWLRGHARG